MKFITKTCLTLSFWALTACSSYAVDNHWQWSEDLEKSIVVANDSVKDIEIGSYWNKEYRNAVFSISNLISKGWSDRGFDAELYNAALKDVWLNIKNIHILNDELIRLTALKWRINLKNKCIQSGVDTSMARKYFTEILGADENILKNAAITGLGMLGEKNDIDILLTLLVENQDSYIGNTALNSLLLIENGAGIKGLSIRLDEISNNTIRGKIKEELSYTRVYENRCNERNPDHP